MENNPVNPTVKMTYCLLMSLHAVLSGETCRLGACPIGHDLEAGRIAIKVFKGIRVQELATP